MHKSWVQKIQKKLGRSWMMMKACNLSTQEVETGNLCEFEASIGYIAIPCLKKKIKSRNTVLSSNFIAGYMLQKI